jgi:hypothetical protein
MSLRSKFRLGRSLALPGAGLTLSLLVLLAPTLLGCAQWIVTTNDKESSLLPAPKMSHDSIVLELTTVELPLDDVALAEAIWQEVDEQQLAVDLRRRLSAAGVRCGVCAGHLPEALKRHMDSADIEPHFVSDEGQPLAVTGPSLRRLQCRTGQKQLLTMADVQDEISLLWQDETSIRGTTLANAQPYLNLRAFPQTSGHVRVSITPEIHHGAAKNRWVGRNGMFLMETAKDQKVFEDLAMELALSPGQFLVVSGTLPCRGLGERFFASNENKATQDMLIFRLAQTQHDDLHASEPAKEPLVTSVP